jgi:GntR family transcriptional repressor for pyruvate dehydrogenase complex
MKALRDARTLQEQVCDAIKQYIISQRLKAGDRLPSEHQMANMLAVSRTSVREALATLAALGIVEIKRGKGAFVCDFDIKTITDQLPYGLQFHQEDLQDLIEIRRLLELYAIEKVIETIEDDQMEQLREIVEAMAVKAQQGEDFVEEDIAFHRTLAEMAGKRVLLLILSGFWEVVIKARQGVPSKERLQVRYEEHLKIFEAVTARKLRDALFYMDAHFDRRSAEVEIPMRHKYGVGYPPS